MSNLAQRQCLIIPVSLLGFYTAIWQWFCGERGQLELQREKTETLSVNESCICYLKP